MPLSEVDSFLTAHDYRNIRGERIEYRDNDADKELTSWDEDSPAFWKEQDTGQDERNYCAIRIRMAKKRQKPNVEL